MPLLLFLLTLVLAACSPYPYPGEEGAIIHATLRSLPRSLDPPQLGTEYSNKVAGQVYEGLLMYHPYARPYRLMPALAAEMPEISEDGLTYTFRLRRGVTFHDDPCFPDGEGRELTAHDFAFAFRRMAHPKVQTTGWWLFAGKLEGFDAWRDQLTADASAAEAAGEVVDTLWEVDRPVPGIEVVDDYTLRFHLTEPYPQFVWTLSMNYTAVYPREAVAHYGAEFRNHPVGTGPFQLTEFHPTYRAVYKANPEYRELRVPDPRNEPEDRVPGWDWEADEAAGLLADAGERVPLVDGMELRFVQEDQPRWLYFKAGYSDWLIPPKDNQAEVLVGEELSEQMVERGVKLELQPELGTVYTCLNTEDPVMSNVTLRRAIALAYDHAWTVKNLYSGNAVIAKSLIPPGVGGHEDDHHPYMSDDGSAQLDRARALIAEAGYPGGVDPKTDAPLRIRFETSGTGTTQRHFAERFRDELRRIGVEVDVIVNTWPQMTEKMRKKDFQVAGLAWSFDYPDAQNILQLLYGPNKAPGINRSNYDNPEYNALYERASVMPDGAERDALYAQMARMVAEDIPWVVRAHRVRAMLHQPWVRGYKYTDVHDQHWRYVAIDRDLRERLVAEWNQPVLWPVFTAVGAFLLLVLGSVLRGRGGSAAPPSAPSKEAA